MTHTDSITVVVDVQRDFVENGALAVRGGQLVADALASKVNPSEVVFYTQDWHIDPGAHFSETPDYVDSWPVHCVAESEGADFAADFGDVPAWRIFRKGQYAASYSGAEGVNPYGITLVKALSAARPRVNVVGIAFDYCVKATALDLAAQGFEVTVIRALTASVHPENDAEVTAELEAAGVTVL